MDDDDDYCSERDFDDEAHPPEFGCCMPGECLMPGLHFESECHSVEMYVQAHKTKYVRAE